MTRGMVLGKFMPPHRGHEYLIRFAAGWVDHLSILLYSRDSDPIPGELRFAWLREMFPAHEVRHVTEALPWEPAEDPEFWTVWESHLARILPGGVDFVFASEDYGPRLAGILGARYVPVDPARATVPVSASEIRADPMGQWRFMPACVRPHFARRVCLFGPESTGKTTLGLALAEALGTVCVPEYARTLLDPGGGRCEREDIASIARGQVASEEALAREANRVLVCDTDLLSTVLWSETLFGGCPEDVRGAAEARAYDLYLLMDVDMAWVDDGQRFLGARREELFAVFREALDSRGRPYVVISGDPERRLATARRAIESLL